MPPHRGTFFRLDTALFTKQLSVPLNVSFLSELPRDTAEQPKFSLWAVSIGAFAVSRCRARASPTPAQVWQGSLVETKYTRAIGQ